MSSPVLTNNHNVYKYHGKLLMGRNASSKSKIIITYGVFPTTSVYIDSTFTGTHLGTIANPYSSLSQVTWNDTTYQIRNCIFYKFIDPYVGHVLSGGVNNNCYWLSTRPQDSTLYYGTPRIYKDPQFIDTTNGNWYTKPGSPATGKGIQPNSPAIQGVGYNYLNKYINFEKNTRNEKDIIFIARRLDDECIFSERQRSV
jgi:hypothetical protein